MHTTVTAMQCLPLFVGDSMAADSHSADSWDDASTQCLAPGLGKPVTACGNRVANAKELGRGRRVSKLLNGIRYVHERKRFGSAWSCSMQRLYEASLNACSNATSTAA